MGIISFKQYLEKQPKLIYFKLDFEGQSFTGGPDVPWTTLSHLYYAMCHWHSECISAKSKILFTTIKHCHLTLFFVGGYIPLDMPVVRFHESGSNEFDMKHYIHNHAKYASFK